MRTYQKIITTFIVVDNEDPPQGVQSFFFPAHIQQELGTLVSKHQADRAHDAREAEDKVQHPPGVEVDAQSRDVVRELKRKYWDGYHYEDLFIQKC